MPIILDSKYLPTSMSFFTDALIEIHGKCCRIWQRTFTVSAQINIKTHTIACKKKINREKKSEVWHHNNKNTKNTNVNNELNVSYWILTGLGTLCKKCNKQNSVHQHQPNQSILRLTPHWTITYHLNVEYWANYSPSNVCWTTISRYLSICFRCAGDLIFIVFVSSIPI